MFIVVDVNVILSALVSRGNSSRFFVLNARENMFNLIAPQFIIIEAGKHLIEIAERSGLPIEECQKDLEFIINQIKLIQELYYEDKLEEARVILAEHQKDVPYLALALKYDCKIFSGDKNLKTIVPEMVKNSKELLLEFDS